MLVKGSPMSSRGMPNDVMERQVILTRPIIITVITRISILPVSNEYDVAVYVPLVTDPVRSGYAGNCRNIVTRHLAVKTDR